ncbi:MAG: hypothetical protein J6X50_05015 [Bacilli bacterium]|nr:hypothetical protein [Bacilli bacterium]
MNKEEQAITQEVEEISKPKLTNKEKRYARLKNRLFKEKDIRYEGPLSYRALRILGWICLALGQVVLLNSLGVNLLHWNLLGPFWSRFCSLVSNLSTPFFIIASFGLVLSGRRNMRDFMLVYGLAYIGIGLGFVFFYLRYIDGLFVMMGLEQTPFPTLVSGFLSDKVQVNVFADLFAFSLFHFFMNYTPKRVFKGKLVIIFRLFALLPIAFVIVSYILKILNATNIIALSFYVFPFLTTKSPIVYFAFVVASLWIKNRERLFIKLGATKEEYQEFLNTNRNSLSMSIHLSLIILISIVFDVILFIFAMIHYGIHGLPVETFSETVVDVYGVGQSSMMVLAIPFILLYSYKRKHKDARIDIAIPICGIALMVVVYIEGIYQFILNILGLQ